MTLWSWTSQESVEDICWSKAIVDDVRDVQEGCISARKDEAVSSPRDSGFLGQQQSVMVASGHGQASTKVLNGF